MAQPTKYTTQHLKQLLEVELDAEVGSSIHMCITGDRRVTVLMEGQVHDMITMLGACLANLHERLAEDEIIPKMNYFKFMLWVYQQSITQAKEHVKNTQAKSEASQASGKSGTNNKTS